MQCFLSFSALIKAHCRAGCTIFTDGWAAYLSLGDEGYAHYIVNHKWTFKCTYVNVNDPSDTTTCHTNSREGEYTLGILYNGSTSWINIYIRFR